MDQQLRVKIRDAQIMYLNFAGKEGKYNLEGQRDFSICLTEDLAKAMQEEGWNISWRLGTPYIRVSVNFKIKPRIVHVGAITQPLQRRTRILLCEDTIGFLDKGNFERVDLVIVGLRWEIGTKAGVKTGVKAYLKAMVVH